MTVQFADAINHNINSPFNFVKHFISKYQSPVEVYVPHEDC